MADYSSITNNYDSE